MVFGYGEQNHSRRHGPRGYESVKSYKDWLRDEFTFRCVYCLFRERWFPDGHWAFSIDHFIPRSRSKAGVTDYENLLYACRRCNTNKATVSQLIDPCASAYGEHLRIDEEGVAHAKTLEGSILVDVLLLNSTDRCDWRKRMMDLIRKAGHLPEIRAYLAYPADLPDLRKLNPPTNSLPAGVDQCYYVLRQKGALAETY